MKKIQGRVNSNNIININDVIDDIQTLDENVSELEEGLSQEHDEREQEVEALSTALGNISSIVSGHTTELAEHENKISGLTGRMITAESDIDSLERAVVDIEANHYTKTESDNKFQAKIDSDHKVASDLIDDSSSSHKFATSEQLEQIGTNTSDISNLQTIISNLDLTEVGSNGSYIKLVSQADGQLSATASSFDTEVPASNPSTYTAPTTAAIKLYVDTNSGKIDKIKVGDVEYTPDQNKIVNLPAFITNTVNNLTNYYLKSETYTKEEVNQIVANFGSFEVVQELPTDNIKTNVIYLVPKQGSGTDVHDEYIYLLTDPEDPTQGGSWELIGCTQIDISGLVPKTTTVNGHALSSDVTVTASDVGLGSVENKGMDDTPTADSLNYVKSGGVKTYVDSAVQNKVTIIETSDITALTAEQLSSLRSGDVVNKVDSTGKHSYRVSFKKDGTGLCLTYTDGSCSETVSYDYVDSNWVYNSTDVTSFSELGKVNSISIGGGTPYTPDTNKNIDLPAYPDVSDFITQTTADSRYQSQSNKLSQLSNLTPDRNTNWYATAIKYKFNSSSSSTTAGSWELGLAPAYALTLASVLDENYKVNNQWPTISFDQYTLLSKAINAADEAYPYQYKNDYLLPVLRFAQDVTIGGQSVRIYHTLRYVTTTYESSASVPYYTFSKLLDTNGNVLFAVIKPTGTLEVQFTKVANYIKPSTGIPASDLADTYLTGISSSDVTTALGYTPYSDANPNNYTSNTGTVTSVSAGTGLSISGTASVNPTVNVDSNYKLPTANEWLGKQDTLISSGVNQNLKTINGNDLLGSGDLVISAGAAETPIVNVGSSTTSQALDANKFYQFGRRTSGLTITLNAGSPSVVNEYQGEIFCDESNVTLTAPAGIVWKGATASSTASSSSVTLLAKCTHQFSILNNKGLVLSFANPALGTPAVTISSNTLSWTAVTNADKYRVQVANQTSSSTGTFVTDVEQITTSYTLTPSVTTFNAPTNLVATYDSTSSSINISWDVNTLANTTGSKYKLAYSTDGTTFTEVNLSTNAYTITSAAAGTTYTFKVKNLAATNYIPYKVTAMSDYYTDSETSSPVFSISVAESTYSSAITCEVPGA